MRRYHSHSERKGEQGLIITLVAVFMASVVVVMAALAIDVTTFYTARSEAQLAADGAALAAARVLANSGMTSSKNLSPAFPTAAAETLARTAAVRVAKSNEIGGKQLISANIVVSFTDSDLSNPLVTVQVSRTDLPTFFLRFWAKQLTVSASATAEAYNPSGSSGSPVAPLCVKPWVLPNFDPTQKTTKAIFNEGTGAIQNSALTGYGWSLQTQTSLVGDLTPGQYYAAMIGKSPNDLPVPMQALPACSSTFAGTATQINYKLAIAGCVSTPIQCGSVTPPPNRIRLDLTTYPVNRDADTLLAAECLLHSSLGQPKETDQIDEDLEFLPPYDFSPPFEFTAGSGNPVTTALGQVDVLVSDSLVTIPVYKTYPNLKAPGQSVRVIGFLQVFLNPEGAALPNPASVPPPYSIPVTIINQVGCGTNATGTPIYGNGPSAVPVRLIGP